VKLSEYRASQCEQAMNKFSLLHGYLIKLHAFYTMKTINKLSRNERALIKREYIKLINKKVINHG